MATMKAVLLLAWLSCGVGAGCGAPVHQRTVQRGQQQHEDSAQHGTMHHIVTPCRPLLLLDY